uniref:T9SS type A sorting domain-containing protein n=1 Tax=candidate division WOR-3 bacterium TaxID=2052148 RepID=A0A7C3UXA0_UNCW3
MKRIIFFILLLSPLLNGLTLDSSNVRTFSRWPYSNWKMSLQLKDTIAIISLYGGLWFINISNPQNPVKIKEYITDGCVRDMILDGEILYIPDPYLGLRVFDISSLDSIEEIGRLIFPGRGFFSGYTGLFIKETLAFAGNSYLDSLEVIDIRDPRNPRRIGVCYCEGGMGEIFARDDYVYVATDWGGLKIFDISNPSSPFLVSEWRAEDGGVTCVQVKDTFAYVANYDTLYILNVSNPGNPREIGRLRMLTPTPERTSTIYDLLVVDTLVYAGVDNPISPQVINVSNPSSPYHIYYRREDKFVMWELQLRSPLLFGLSGFCGLVIYDITEPTSWEVLSTFGVPFQAEQVMLATDSLIAIGGYIDGLFLLDITDPISPRDRGGYPVKFSYNPYDTLVGRLGFTMGLEVKDTFLFAGGLGDNCLHILNFSNPDSIRRIAVCTVARRAGIWSSGIRSLFLQESLIYVGLSQGGGGQGLVICDVKNPLLPRVLGRVELHNVDMYSLKVIGNICYGAGGNGGFFIFDVSDPVNPYVRGHIPPYSTWGYVNDVWVRDTFAYLAESFDGIGIVKVKDPTNPRRITQCPAPGQCLGVCGSENLLFLACGFLGGLRVWDISDPINPREVGYYLTGGGPDGLQYRNGIIHTCGGEHGYWAFEYYGVGVKERGNGDSLWFECLPTVGKKFIIRSPFKGFSFYLYDAQGRLVLKDVLNKRETIFSLKGRPEGVYFILIKKEGKSLLRRIINLK